MAEASQPQLVEIDPDFEPLSRPRSCTWPLPRPDFSDPANSNTSSPAPSVKQEPGANVDFINNLSLLEETEDYGDHKTLALCNDFQCRENCIHQQTPHQHRQQQLPSPQIPHQQQVPSLSSPIGTTSSVAAAAAQRKSSSSRRNAWGNMSYADLITKAIESSPEKRLTLSQIYDWMVKSVPYFKDKGDSNSSAGWKNSIRHNLSLHSRFVRVQNEGTGKSSWWMLNPEGGKSGKSPRRRAASMDNNSKFAKSRGRAAKKKGSLQGGVDAGAESPVSQYSKWPGSPNSHSNDDFDAWTSFRPRTSSNASTLSGRLSPFMPEQEDLGDPDVHLVYPGGSGAKMAATLPSLSEVAGSLGRHGSENAMENLLDNLNLLSPSNAQAGGGGGAGGGSAQSSPSSMMQASPGYPPYSSPNMVSQQPPQQDYRKCLYGQAVVNSMSTIPMQALSEAKPGFGSYLGPYSCPAGLLKELLTADGDPGAELMPPVEAVSPQSGGRGRMMPAYNSQQPQLGHGGKMMSQHSRQHPHMLPGQAPPTPAGVNGHTLLSLGGLTHAGVPPRMGPAAKTHLHLPPSHAHQSHLATPPGYRALHSNGYGRPCGPPPNPHPHPHPHAYPHSRPPHPDRLPSDLDDMSIERFECDVDSVLHDALMDGDSLDFNFDPTVAPQGFPHGAKTTTHSWVSG